MVFGFSTDFSDFLLVVFKAYAIIKSMEPSNDNPFGSFSSGETKPGELDAAQKLEMAQKMGMVQPQPIMTSQMSSQPTVTSGSGDIILDSGGGKSKGKIILAVIGVIVLIVVIVIAFMYGSSFMGAQKNSELRVKFNRYANYVLYGEESDEEIDSDLYLNYDYYFSNNDLDDEGRREMYDRVDELFSAFLEEYEGIDNLETITDDEGLLEERVESEKQLLDFIRVVYIKDYLNSYDVYGMYIFDGREAALSDAKSYYEFPDMEDNQYVIDFVEDYDYWVDNTIKMLDLYNNNGCIYENTIDHGCMNGKSDEVLNELSEVKEAVLDGEEYVEYYYGLSNDYILNMFVINALMNDGDVSDYIIYRGDSDEE